MSHPTEIDLSELLVGTFGCIEFEDAACVLVRFLSSEASQRSIPAWLDHNPNGKGWEKSFYMRDLPIDSTLFAMLCAAGWIQNYWFPKGSFVVSQDFVSRLEGKWLKTLIV